jgi:hypothetical protein
MAERYQSGEEVAEAVSEWLGDGASNGNQGSPLAYPPPTPSLNEDLTLAPLEDEQARGEPRPSDSKASGIGSKSGEKSPGSSGIKKSASSSNIMGGETAKEPTSKAKSAPRPLPKMAAMTKADDLMDELLSAPALPPTEPLRTAPLTTTRMYQEEPRSPIWLVLLIGVGGAGLIVGAILLLIWYAGL